VRDALKQFIPNEWPSSAPLFFVGVFRRGYFGFSPAPLDIINKISFRRVASTKRNWPIRGNYSTPAVCTGPITTTKILILWTFVLLARCVGLPPNLG